jgi:integrase
MEPRNLTRILHRLCEEAGIPRERLHNLRHTAATIGYAQGLGDVEIQRMVGHQRPSTTRDLYVHAVPALGREAADRLSEVLGGKPRHLRVTGMPPASGDLDSGLHADA